MPPVAGRRSGKIADERIELAVGLGGERGAESLLELVGKEPTLRRRLMEAFGDLLAVGV
jgi:hypothetical protein